MVLVPFSCFGIFVVYSGWLTYVFLVLQIFEFLGCILLIVSIWLQKSLLVICFLIADIMCIIWYLVNSIIDMVNGEILEGVLMIFIIFLLIYFWICVLSWFIELRQQEEEN
ncbi:hypothetical protein ACLKA6_012387 [Drosophila palustris]